MERTPGKHQVLLEEVLVSQQGVLTLWFVWVLTPSIVTRTLFCQKAPYFGWDVKPRSWLSVVIKNPRMSFEKSRGVTSASWPNLPIGLLIIPIHMASSLCLLSTNKLVCGERSGTLWLLSHHQGGCCTLVVDEETPPSQCRALWVLRKALYKCNELLLLLLL